MALVTELKHKNEMLTHQLQAAQDVTRRQMEEQQTRFHHQSGHLQAELQAVASKVCFVLLWVAVVAVVIVVGFASAPIGHSALTRQLCCSFPPCCHR